uniref:uncharacterized protein LOC108950209 isoform X1 n=1 Tax=Ciona intestinalis TaxID=7719 RepID=UPI000EF54C82|nr:uncharacterized protein LOC108950209 isoform X1 [Ciona intestinalis]|eukprot:XP_026693911.1 uncharacterized protein LOC108950209 isoform X1 [Ciona intestinalis]
MPMGLSNSAVTFQNLKRIVLTCMEWKGVLAYLDDIVVYGRNFGEHLKRLYEVLNRIEENVRFLGHIGSKDGIACDPDKTAAVASGPVPRSVKQAGSLHYEQITHYSDGYGNLGKSTRNVPVAGIDYLTQFNFEIVHPPGVKHKNKVNCFRSSSNSWGVIKLAARLIKTIAIIQNYVQKDEKGCIVSGGSRLQFK